MSKLFRRHSGVACFYCGTAITPFPRNPRAFRCPHCDCWNRYNNAGEIMSDEPAMHDERLNTRSFAKRGSPSKDSFPSTYRNVIFCHTCQTNQMLMAQLLSNWLPSPNDPEYVMRSATYDEYRRSVEQRYPPVCANCAPAVEEEIRRRDHMARTRALGGFLRETKRTTQQASKSQRDKDRLERELAAWRVRGCLWLGSLACALGGYLAVITKQNIWFPSIFRIIVPAMAFCSIFWSAWDPTYASLRRARFQGRAVRQRGKREYNVLQVMIWLSRLCTSLFLAIALFKPEWDHVRLWDEPHSMESRIYCSTSIALELFVLLRSFFVLQLQRPPSVRLTDGTDDKSILVSPTSSQPCTRSTTPATLEPDLLGVLSLSSKPTLPNPTPTSYPQFGVPSLPSVPSAGSSIIPPMSPLGQAPDNEYDLDIGEDELPHASDNPDAMDWTPTRPFQRSASEPARHFRDDHTLLRPQRFFAPEEQTGLENLFARTIKLADDEQQGDRRSVRAGANSARRGAERRQTPLWWWAVIGVLPLLPLAGAAWYGWWRGYHSFN